MATITTPAPTVNSDAPTIADRAWWAEQSADHHANEPTPVDALGEPWSSWPAWTDERWTLSDAEADAMADESAAQFRMESMGYL